MWKLAFVLFSLMVTLIACAPPAARNSPEIAARDEAWEAAFNAGDAARLAAIYADDARLLAPNAAMTRGKAAIEAEFGKMIADRMSGSLNPLETTVAGDTGYSVGTYEVRSAKGALVDRGKYVETFRNEAGEWRITNDIWNSDMPAGPREERIIVHRVKDDARWLAAWEGEHGRREMFAQHGAPSVRIFASADRPNEHALLVGIEDLDAFTAWMGSPEVAAAKAEDGVLDEGFMVFAPIEK